jgi:hypothetical protein
VEYVTEPGEGQLALPYPVCIPTAPEATPKRVRTFVQSNPIAAVCVRPSSSFTSNKDIAPEAGNVILSSLYYFLSYIYMKQYSEFVTKII